MHFYSLEDPDALIKHAFDHARKNASFKRTRKSAIQHRKEKIVYKMERFVEYLDKQLNHAYISIPRFDKMHPFYKELLPETLQVDKLKQVASQIVAVRKLLARQLRDTKRRIHSPTNDDKVGLMKAESSRFFGKCASIMKSLKKNVTILQDANRVVKEVPDVKVDVPTLILAGYPNTGKTTLLKRLTGSKAQIASYPFTTKSLQLGYFTMRYREIQVIDTPGLLDQEKRTLNPIEKKAMAALQHLGTCILFVVDPTPHSGYTLEKQHDLFDQLSKQFKTPFLIVINKCDMSQKEDIQAAEKVFGIDSVREGEGLESNLKDKLWRALGFGR